MKSLLLTSIAILAIQCCHSQTTNRFFRNVADVEGTVIKKEEGSYTDPKSGRQPGHYAITYIIDTLNRQLLNVSTFTKDSRGTVVYFYTYKANRLTGASSGVVQNGYTIIQNTYDYDAADFKISSKDLEAISQVEEKFALLKESQKYLGLLKK